MIIAVDFDGTIVEHSYPHIGKPLPYVYDTLRWLRDVCNDRLILWTCREGKELEDAIDVCRFHGVEFDAINSNIPALGIECRKVFAHWYIDDKANTQSRIDWLQVRENRQEIVNNASPLIINNKTIDL